MICVCFCKRSVVHGSGCKAISARVIKAWGSSHTPPFPKLPFQASSDFDQHRHLIKIILLVPTRVSVVPSSTLGRWEFEHCCNPQVPIDVAEASGEDTQRMESITFYEIYVAEHIKGYWLSVLKLRMQSPAPGPMSWQGSL